MATSGDADVMGAAETLGAVEALGAAQPLAISRAPAKTTDLGRIHRPEDERRDSDMRRECIGARRPRGRQREVLERETRFELATSSLEGCRSAN
jgi:hypothetical protein